MCAESLLQVVARVAQVDERERIDDSRPCLVPLRHPYMYVYVCICMYVCMYVCGLLPAQREPRAALEFVHSLLFVLLF